MSRRLLALCVLATALGSLGCAGFVSAHVAVAAAPSTAPLTGETFMRDSGGAFGIPCRQGGGPFTFSLSGIAAGPYPGRFTEIGGGRVLGGYVIAFSARFTIDDVTGRLMVTGTTRFDPTVPYAGLACYAEASAYDLMNIPTTYDAIVVTASGVAVDQGRAVIASLAAEADQQRVHESFSSVAIHTGDQAPNRLFDVEPVGRRLHSAATLG